MERSAPIDGFSPAAVRAYLEHFWEHWSGPGYTPDSEELDRLAEAYGAPGAFAAPTTVLWPARDPRFPVQWSDRIDEFFSAATLSALPDSGHFSPLEAAADFAAAIAEALGR